MSEFKDLNRGDLVEFKLDYYDLMVGRIERILSLDAHNRPVDVTYHVVVSSNHPRNSGIFQLSKDKILRVLR